MNINQYYSNITRLTSLVLGVAFMFVGVYLLINLLSSPATASWFHVAIIPMLAFAVILIQVAWLGSDPLWLYKLFDVQSMMKIQMTHKTAVTY